MENVLKVLADRIEALTGPDREVDAEIARTVYADNCRNPDWECGYVLTYTASLDAAMTLVPDDMAFLLDWGHYSSEPKGVLFWEAYVQFKDDAVNRGDAEAATPALALTAACLRARAQAEALS